MIVSDPSDVRAALRAGWRSGRRWCFARAVKTRGKKLISLDPLWARDFLDDPAAAAIAFDPAALVDPDRSPLGTLAEAVSVPCPVCTAPGTAVAGDIAGTELYAMCDACDRVHRVASSKHRLIPAIRRGRRALPRELARLARKGSAEAKKLLDHLSTCWSKSTSRYCALSTAGGAWCWAEELVDDPWQARAECAPGELVPLAACRREPCTRCGGDALVVFHEEVDPAAFDRDRYVTGRSTLCPACGQLG